MRHTISLLALLLFTFSAVGQVPANSTSQAPASLPSLELPPDAALLAELSKPLDARQCKQSELVEAQVIKDLKRGKQVFVKSGTKLQGHILSVQAPPSPDGETVLAIKFDRARTKSGQEFGTRLTLQALAPEPNIQGNSDSMMSGRGLEDNRLKASAGDPKKNTITGNIRELDESSRGVYYWHGIKLSTETTSDGVSSMITWTGVDPVLKKNSQMLFVPAH